jgi:hypothetical protein
MTSGGPAPTRSNAIEVPSLEVTMFTMSVLLSPARSLTGDSALVVACHDMPRRSVT